MGAAGNCGRLWKGFSGKMGIAGRGQDGACPLFSSIGKTLSR